MQCSRPLLMQIELDGVVYTTPVPCQSCYACQCNKRAEFAVRCKYEMKDPRNKTCHFITLTYDDAHLPVMAPNGFDVARLNYYNACLLYTQRRYDYSLLRKDHVMKFMKDMNNLLREKYIRPSYYYCKDDPARQPVRNQAGYYLRSIREIYRDFCKRCKDLPVKERPKFAKSDYKPVWPEDSRFRIYLTGEYGDLTHRSHYHIIIFSPVELHKVDYQNMLAKCWPYGQVNVGLSCQAAACNYVAKHQVKSCQGNNFQQLVAPIFSLMTRYLGSIGRTMKDDQSLMLKWQNYLINHTKEGLYIENIQGNKVYKVAFPRFLTRYLHPDRLDKSELERLLKDGMKNIYRFFADNWEKFPNLRDNNFDFQDCNFEPEPLNSSDPDHRFSEEYYEKYESVERHMAPIVVNLRQEDDLRRVKYEKSRLLAKTKKFMHSGNLTNFNSN